MGTPIRTKVYDFIDPEMGEGYSLRAYALGQRRLSPHVASLRRTVTRTLQFGPA